MDPFWYLCFVFVILSCQFIAALWSPAGKGLISWLSFGLNFISLYKYTIAKITSTKMNSYKFYTKGIQRKSIGSIWLSFVRCFPVFLSLSHVVPWVRRGN